MLKPLIAAALLAMTAGQALAADGAAATDVAALTPNGFVWKDDTSMRPISIVVSVADQKAYVYRGETLIAASSVSTGKDGKDTPTGTFPILQKEEMHRSNLYNAAPMPFMQRLTWDGVAIHAGRNPGFPASHGCIRVPEAFARKLFAVTTVGTQVLVTDESVADGIAPPSADDPAAAAETAAADASELAMAGR